MKFLYYIVCFLFFNRISPLGVAFLITAKIIEMHSLVLVVQQLGWYFLTVMLGLILHGFGN